jgi:hypothetical protein
MGRARVLQPDVPRIMVDGLLKGTVKNPEFAPLWAILREMIAIHEPNMSLDRDEPGYYRLIRPNGRPFAMTVVQKNHVGLYLISLHENQDLFDSLNPILKGRLGGKSFRFKDEEDLALEFIPSLLQACADLGEH